MIVRGTRAGSTSQSTVKSISELENGKFAVTTGTINGPIAEAHFPNGQVNYYNSQTDTMTALRTGKVDAMVGDEAVIR
ncbi:MAG: transporter substrate-binding domain-containing protein [Lachnospiraceae bacterium]|nr:transporter substrate-binding domain-containing protein [Lachnospiraceae bacterium]